MIKGVNKQIIEIKCPNDERFEKILLFVNSKNYPYEQGGFDENAEMVAKTFLENGISRKSRLKAFFSKHGIAAGVCTAAVAAAVLITALLI